MSFRPKNEHQLSKLSDDDLVAYLIAARDTGYDEEVRKTTWILIDRRSRQLAAFVSVRIRDTYDTEEIVQMVIEAALQAKFRGGHTEAFFSMLFRIARNKIADYFERKKRERENVQPISDDLDPPGPEGQTDGFEAAVDLKMAIEQVISGFSDRDQMVIRLKMKGHPAKEVARMVSSSGVDGAAGLTSTNCDQIFSRFRKRLGAFLDPRTEGGA